MSSGLRILLGVCGHGYGHCSRQLEIARRLTERGHSVRIVTFGRGHRFFAATEFAHLVSPVFVPWIDCDSTGIRWRATVRMNVKTFVPGLIRNLRTFAALSRSFRPDVCVADYEPVIARFARRWRRPLLTIDQSSKYLGYQMPEVGGLSREEERSRLATFFPIADRRLATSFYTMDYPRDEEFDVEIIPPVIKSSIVEAAAAVQEPCEVAKQICVYLSSYPEKNSSVDHQALFDILSTFTEWSFQVYSQDVDAESRPASNINLHAPSSEAFVRDLVSSRGLICTAGHTLLSEAMALKLPVFAIPLFTYDQHLCARIVSQYKLGLGLSPGEAVTRDKVEVFLTDLPKYRQAITTSPHVASGAGRSAVDIVCDAIEELGRTKVSTGADVAATAR